VNKKTQTRLHHKIHHHAKMAMVPHKKNQYRPHLIRVPGLTVVFALMFITLGTYNLSSTGSVLGDTANISATGLLAQTNEARNGANEAPLILNSDLNKAAQLKAHDMLANQYWAHTAPDGTEPWAWFDEVGYDYVAAGENLAKGFTSDRGIVAAWMNSREHRENVLNAGYTEVGFGVIDGLLEGKETKLVVALYGTPLEPSVAGSMTGSFIEAPIGAGSIMTRTGYYLQSVSPAVLASFVLLLITAIVAFVAHGYRSKLPKNWRMTWRKHHGLYSGVISLLLIVTVITLYSGGQI